MALSGIAAAGSPPKEPVGLTAPHYVALGKLIGALPVSNLVALFEGRATAGTVIDLAEQAAGIVAAAFPPAAFLAGEIELGLEALRFLFGAAGLATPIRLSPGQNPLRGGFEGARGHI